MSNTVMSVYPKSNKCSARKLSPPPTSNKGASLGTLSPAIKSNEVCGVGWYQLVFSSGLVV